MMKLPPICLVCLRGSCGSVVDNGDTMHKKFKLVFGIGIIAFNDDAEALLRRGFRDVPAQKRLRVIEIETGRIVYDFGPASPEPELPGLLNYAKRCP